MGTTRKFRWRRSGHSRRSGKGRNPADTTRKSRLVSCRRCRHRRWGTRRNPLGRTNRSRPAGKFRRRRWGTRHNPRDTRCMFRWRRRSRCRRWDRRRSPAGSFRRSPLPSKCRLRSRGHDRPERLAPCPTPSRESARRPRTRHCVRRTPPSARLQPKRCPPTTTKTSASMRILLHPTGLGDETVKAGSPRGRDFCPAWGFRRAPKASTQSAS